MTTATGRSSRAGTGRPGPASRAGPAGNARRTPARAGASRRPGPAYALPAFVFFTLFAVLPMVLVGYLSLTSWHGFGFPGLSGFGNWRRLAGDPEVRSALLRTLALTGLSWLLQTPLALLIGVWAAGPQRSRAVLSALFFLPLVLSTAAVALLWQVLLDPNFGMVRTLPLLGGIDFRGDRSWALYTVVFVVSWQYIPFHTLLYQGAARRIPAGLYEAAILDGAGRAGQFRHITLPQLRWTFVTSSILMLVGSLTTFDTVLILTNGGPGTTTRILPLYMYDIGFGGFELGYGSTIAVLLLVLGAGLSLAVTRLTAYRSMSSQLEGQ